MKGKFCLLFVFVAIFGYGQSTYWIDPNEEGYDFLLTFPRSGTNLTAAYIQATTGKKVSFILRNDHKKIDHNRLNIPLDDSKKPLVRTHNFYSLVEFNRNKNKLLFVLRDYKESIHRNLEKPTTEQEFLNVFISFNRIFDRYIGALQTYDRWDPNLRLLVYYEDLILHPKEEIIRILTFLEEEIPENLSDDFLKEVADKTRQSYDQQYRYSGGSQSKGQDLHYHAKQFSLETILEIDRVVEFSYPELWERYLKRYRYIVE